MDAEGQQVCNRAAGGGSQGLLSKVRTPGLVIIQPKRVNIPTSPANTDSSTALKVSAHPSSAPSRLQAAAAAPHRQPQANKRVALAALAALALASHRGRRTRRRLLLALLRGSERHW